MTFFKSILLSVRSLSKSRLFTSITLMCLTLGMGVGVALFSVISSILFQPLPYEAPEDLVMIFDHHKPTGQSYAVSPPNFDTWQREASLFSSLEASRPMSFGLAGEGEPIQVSGAAVSAGFFRLLGISPALGRDFSPTEDQPPGAAVALLSHGLWQQLGGRSNLLGQSVDLDGLSYEVIGVMPAGFDFPDQSRLWIPLGLDPYKQPDSLYHTLFVAGRLQGGTLEMAQSEMDNIAAQLAETLPSTNADWGADIQQLEDYLVGDVRPAFMALSLAVGLVLLIACSNVTSLMLARLAVQRGELAMRTALGAEKKDLLKRIFQEGLLLATVSAGAGLLLTYLLLDVIAALIPEDLLAVRDLNVDFRVFVFAGAIALISAIVVSIGPILTLLRANLATEVREGSSKIMVGRRQLRFLQLLVVLEISLAFVLMVAAGFILKDFVELQRSNTGYNAENLLTLRFSFPDSRYAEGHQRVAFFEQALEQIEALPQVESAGVTIVLPVGDRMVSAMFAVEGRVPSSSGEMLLTNNRMISTHYLQAMQIPVIEGRYFNRFDQADTQGVVIVSQEMARQYWPGESALGKRVKRGRPDSENPWLTVVGIAQDVRDTTLDSEISPSWYLPYTQHNFKEYSMVVRPKGAATATSLVPDLRRVVWSIDPSLPIQRIMTMEDRLGESLSRQRFSVWLMSLFTLLGILLAAAGVYGLVSYTVGMRINEVGVRLALGATRQNILARVLREASVLILLGIAIGLPFALLAPKVLISILGVDLSPSPGVLFGSALILLVTAITACLLPASRASQTDPIHALRWE